MTLSQEPWKFSFTPPPPPHPSHQETSEKGVSISERWFYEKRHTWVCKGKILQWSLGYSFSTGELFLLTSFSQDSADKHIPSKTSRSVSSIPWITPEIRRKIRRKNKTHAKAKKTGSSKLRSKIETLRREITTDVRKQHDLYVNNLVGDVKANPRDFYRYINSHKKDTQGIPPLKRKNGKGVAQSDLEKAEEFNG